MSSRRSARNVGKAKASHKSPSVVAESDYEDSTPTPVTPKRKRAAKDVTTFSAPPPAMGKLASPGPSPSKKPRKALPEHDALSPVPDSTTDENVFLDQAKAVDGTTSLDQAKAADGTSSLDKAAAATDAESSEGEGPSTLSDADEPVENQGNGSQVDALTEPVYEERVVRSKKVQRITHLPSVCAFSDARLFDPAISQKGLHQGLPPLPHRYIVGYGDHAVQEINPETGEPYVRRFDVAALRQAHPKLSKAYILSLLTFVRKDAVANPARADPRDFIVREGYSRSDSSAMEIATSDGSKIMTWLSLVVASGSKIVDGILPSFGSKRLVYKFLSGVQSQGDGDRKEAFFPTMFGHDSLYAEIIEGGIAYQTRYKKNFTPADDTGPVSPVSKSTSMLGGLKLTNVASRPRPTPVNAMSGYDFSADVPIYDGRNVKIDPACILSVILSLNKWQGEIPDGACVLVAYTAQANQYKDNPWKLTLYIRFAVVVACN
ncbi:hypothetical protein BKA70DRAFT_1444400 [Coprinopsis sp. MPI-PUGE-AT-0042]|nr:hypothetical protein BKA70DRAFT_1444400 [Coprinopsis sp. MPI-PUGE-AT-0042]